MAHLEDLTTGARVSGLVTGQVVTVVQVQWHGTQAVTLTSTLTYRNDAGPSTSDSPWECTCALPKGSDSERAFTLYSPRAASYSASQRQRSTVSRSRLVRARTSADG